jgi:hypothetical protein
MMVARLMTMALDLYRQEACGILEKGGLALSRSGRRGLILNHALAGRSA